MTPDPHALLEDARRDLAVLPVVLPALLAGLDAEQARHEPSPGRWSPVEIVCHLRDEEVEDFGARLRVVVDGGTAFAAIHPGTWVVERRYREEPLALALDAFLAARRESLAWLGVLDPELLQGTVVHPSAGTFSGLDLLAAWAVHDLLHLRQLAGTLACGRAHDWAGLRCEYAGEIPYLQPLSS